MQLGKGGNCSLGLRRSPFIGNEVAFLLPVCPCTESLNQIWWVGVWHFIG